MGDVSWGYVISQILAGVYYTVLLTVVSFVVALVLGFPIALMRLSRWRAVRLIGTAYVEIGRGIPSIAWMLLVFYGLVGLTGAKPLPTAMVALSLVATSYVAENYRAALLEVPIGQWEAAQALGLTRRQLFWRVITPQGVGLAIPPSATYAIGLLKESAFASVIGVSDVTFRALTLSQSGQPGLAVFILAGVVYLLLSLPIAAASRWISHSARTRSAA